MMVILFNYRLILFLNTYATRIILLSKFVLSDFLSDGSIGRIKDQLDRILGIFVIKFLLNIEKISGKLIKCVRGI